MNKVEKKWQRRGAMMMNATSIHVMLYYCISMGMWKTRRFAPSQIQIKQRRPGGFLFLFLLTLSLVDIRIACWANPDDFSLPSNNR